VILVEGNIKMPNGLVFSPDEKFMYIDSSHPTEQKIFRFEVTSNGSFTNKYEFYHFQSNKNGVPDGMTVDVKGNLYCAGPGGIWILNDSGTHIGSIELPELPSNCTWGDKDLKTLYITAQTSIYKVKTKIGLSMNDQVR
jgi:gluconolactonase